MEIDPSCETGELERRRENRLTNIVDQLLHSKASRSAPPPDDAKVERGGIADGVEERGVAGKASDGKARRKRLAQRVEHIKDERCSPDADRPDSPGLARTPPMDGLHASRNYSDFMRSLAAKYNNNSVTAAAADYGRFDARLFKASLPEPGSSASAAISALAAFPQFAFPRQADDSLKRERDYVNPFALPGLDPAHPALPGFPAMDMSSTQALLSMVRSASSVGSAGSVRDARPARRPDAAAPHSPLDLSAQPVKRALGEPRLDVDSLPAKKKYLHAEERLASPREKRTPTPKTGQLRCRSACPADGCGAAASELSAWSVGEVVDFVRDIDLCAEYAEVFREHAIDGSTLPLLTEDHLTASMGLKLGPALKLRTALAKRIGHCAICLHCAHCHAGEAPPAPGAQE